MDIHNFSRGKSTTSMAISMSPCDKLPEGKSGSVYVSTDLLVMNHFHWEWMGIVYLSQTWMKRDFR